MVCCGIRILGSGIHGVWWRARREPTREGSALIPWGLSGAGGAGGAGGSGEAASGGGGALGGEGWGILAAQVGPVACVRVM